MVVSVFMQSKVSGSSVSWSTPASVTTNVGLNTVSNCSTGMFYGLLATAGATGNLTSTSTNQWGAVLLAIQPAAATPTPTPTPTATPTAGASFHGDGLSWWSRLATPIPSWQMTPVIMGNN